MLTNMCSPKFDNCHGTGDPTCFKNHANSWCPDIPQFCLMSGLKFTLPNVISFLPDNLSGVLKKLYSGLHCNVRPKSTFETFSSPKQMDRLSCIKPSRVTFNQQVPRKSWCSLYQCRKNERPICLWSPEISTFCLMSQSRILQLFRRKTNFVSLTTWFEFSHTSYK